MATASEKQIVLGIVNHKFQAERLTELHRSMAIDEVEQAILTFCNINKVPLALKYVWANMVVDLLNYQYAHYLKDSGEAGIDEGDMTSIKVGDTEISFVGKKNDSSSAVLHAHVANLDDVLLNYKDQLYAFRRMVW